MTVKNNTMKQIDIQNIRDFSRYRLIAPKGAFSKLDYLWYRFDCFYVIIKSHDS